MSYQVVFALFYWLVLARLYFYYGRPAGAHWHHCRSGQSNVPTAAVLAMLPLHKGDLFSRSKLIQSQKLLAESGKFDPIKITVNPQPIPSLMRLLTWLTVLSC